MSSSSSIQWFVQMGSGITLGPMPGDDLLELAQSGSLLEQDKVRAGTTGLWHPAGDISNLFGENTSGDALAPPQPTKESPDSVVSRKDDPPATKSREPHQDNEPVKTTPEFKSRQPHIRLPQDSPPYSEAPTNDPTIDRPKVEDAGNTGFPRSASADDTDVELKDPVRQKTFEDDPIPIAKSLDEFDVSTDLPDPPNGSESSDSDELDFELNLPTPHREPAQNNLKADSADLISDPSDTGPDELNMPKAAAGSQALDADETNNSPLPTEVALSDSSTFESRELESPKPIGQPSTTASSASGSSLPRSFDVDPSSRRRITSGASSDSSIVKRVIQVSIAIGLAAGLLMAIKAVWPSGEPRIYSNYLTIYEKLRQYRNGDLDQSGWNEFTTQAKSQLDETLLWLDESATADDRGKTLLLFAGRDLREALNHSPDSENPHGKRLDGLLDQLDGIYSK